ncbi:unnamed protein product [Oikopleura dioica]|uniref:Nuclear receptor domain-containing protein n=1 Tax=Oikopleura dioica TaxID=34765 RepID=E4YBU5_OIKDI|nr:unnamed protein product [Oikopleura dioica]
MKDNEMLYCQICGEKNPGLLYGGRSCKSCMYFFRRVTYEEITFFCSAPDRKGHCVEQTDCIKCRRSCRSCRFKVISYHKNCIFLLFRHAKTLEWRLKNTLRSVIIFFYSSEGHGSPTSPQNNSSDDNKISEDTLQGMVFPYEEHFFVSISNVWDAYVKGLIPDNHYMTSWDLDPVEMLRKGMSNLVIHHQQGAMNVNPKLGQLMVYKTLLSKHIICLTFLINYIPGFAEMEQSTKDTIVSKSWFAAKILRGVTVTNPENFSHTEITGEEIPLKFYSDISVPQEFLKDIQFVICAIASQGSNLQEMPVIMAIIILSVDLEDENVALKDRASLHRLLTMASTVLIKIIKQVNFTVNFQRHISRVFQHMQITKQKLRSDRNEISDYQHYEPKIKPLNEIPTCP